MSKCGVFRSKSTGCIQSWKIWKSHENLKASFCEMAFFLSFIQYFNTRICLCNQIKFWCLPHQIKFWCLPHLPVLLLEPCEWFLKTKPAGFHGFGVSSWPWYMSLSYHEACERSLIKHPARDACLCRGELPALPAPHLVFLITL